MIPKVIYFLHLGEKPMPVWAGDNIRAWAEMNPDYRIEIVTDYTRYRIPYEIEHIYKISDYGIRGDIDRVNTIFHNGGVYCDWDMIPLRPLGDLLDDCKFCIGYSYRVTSGAQLSNAEPAFFASIAHHLILYKYLDNIEKRDTLLHNAGCWWLSGPGYWTDLLNDYFIDEVAHENAGFTQIIRYAEVKILPYTSFYMTAQGKTIEEIRSLVDDWPCVYGAHEWRYSWAYSRGPK